MNEVAFRSVLAVCAHPDDESFGLGAILSTLVDCGATVRLLCLTRGEATSLGSDFGDSATVRSAELAAAATALGVSEVRQCAFADGQLTDVDPTLLSLEVEQVALDGAADCLVVFDDGGITGHPDHRAATDAARMAAQHLHLPVLAWVLPEHVATTLNEEFHAGFVGRLASEIDIHLMVDRRRQHEAISCHASQSTNNPVLRRRLELVGSTEALRWLVHPTVSG